MIYFLSTFYQCCIVFSSAYQLKRISVQKAITVLKKQQGRLQLHNSFGTPFKILDAKYYYISRTYGNLTTFHYKNVFKISHSYHHILFLQCKDKNLHCENSIMSLPVLSSSYNIVPNGSSHNFSVASHFIVSNPSYSPHCLLENIASQAFLAETEHVV